LRPDDVHSSVIEQRADDDHAAPWSPATAGAVVAATVVALTLALYRIGTEPFDYDEAYSLRFVRTGWLGVWTADNGNQSLYLALLRAWRFLATSEVGVRLLSVAPFVATVPILALLARRLYDRRVAVLAAWLAATHPLLAFYAQEARGYSWTVFAFTAGVLGVVTAVQDRRRGPWWWGAVALAASAYLHPAAALGVVAVVAWCWWLPRDAVPAGRVRTALVIGALWVPLAVITLRAGSDQISWANGYETLRAVGVLYALPGDTRVSVLLLVAAITGFVWASDAIGRLGHTVEGWLAGLPVVWIGGTAALVAVVALRQSLVVARFLLYLVPPVLLLAAYAACRVSWRRIAVVVLAAVVLYHGAVVARRAGDSRRQPWDRVDAVLSKAAQPGDGLVAIPATIVVPLELPHLAHGGGPPDPVVPDVRWGAMPVLSTKDVRTPPPVPDHPLPARLWVVRPPAPTSAEAAFLTAVLRGYTRASRVDVDLIVVELWTRTP